MKNLVIALCLASAGLATVSAQAATDSTDYVARLNEEGLYCAKVKVETVGRITTSRTYCRTLEGWEKAGYLIGQKEVNEVQ